MSPVSELRRLIEAIMAGDESKVTATALETLLVDQFFGSKAYEALGEPLALFSPGAGSPYVDGPELRRLIAACEPALRVLYEEGPRA